MREKPVLVRSYQRAPSVQRDAADHWELPKNVHHIEHRSTLSVPSVREQCALVTTGKTPTARPRIPDRCTHVDGAWGTCHEGVPTGRYDHGRQGKRHRREVVDKKSFILLSSCRNPIDPKCHRSGKKHAGCPSLGYGQGARV